MSTKSSDDRLVFRCPYCTVGGEFKLMIAYKDGQFVCQDCSHQERTNEAFYRCSCPRCLKLAMGLSSITHLWTGLNADAAHG